jgi:rare lipoprotein A
MKAHPFYIFLFIIILLMACSLTKQEDILINDFPENVYNTPSTAAKKTKQYSEQGLASFMADELHGQKTASGELFNMRALTAAHKHLPFGTIVKVTNLKNRKSVTVTINDRGPYVKDRIIDVSFEAAKRLGFVNEGVVLVKINVLKIRK